MTRAMTRTTASRDRVRRTEHERLSEQVRRQQGAKENKQRMRGTAGYTLTVQQTSRLLPQCKDSTHEVCNLHRDTATQQPTVNSAWGWQKVVPQHLRLS